MAARPPRPRRTVIGGRPRILSVAVSRGATAPQRAATAGQWHPFQSRTYDRPSRPARPQGSSSTHQTYRTQPAGRATPPAAPETRPSRGLVGTSLLLFASFVVLAAVVFLGAVGGFLALSVGLPDPHQLDAVPLSSESAVYDRTGTVVLAHFGAVHREVVTWDQLSPVLVDATTAVEDKTFWTNTGFDPLAILKAGLDTIRGDSRGASTITQQLVRARLLDPALVADPGRRVERKLKEIVQSIRLTQAYPGDAGKQAIMTAYLNQNYYGNNDYGVMAAARDYFGVTDLSKLTLAQAAILAGIPQSPSAYDLVRNASTDDQGRLVVPPDAPIVQRRNMILDLLASGRTPLSGSRYSAADFEAAKAEPVVLAPQRQDTMIAPHFIWALRDELTTKLCGPDAPTCPAIESGGLKIVSTLDVKLQAIAEKWVKAATVVPNASDPAAAAKRLGLAYQPWMRNLRGKQVNNGALVALDYQTGELVAYVGSADYYATKATKRFQPKFDVAGSGWRQPGSAFKPFNYITGIDAKTMTAATMFMDVYTDFGGGYKPTDADNLERGPVRVQDALRFSLNVPAVKALQVNGVDSVFATAQRFGMKFQNATPNAGLSLTLGTEEVHPVDLVTAYGTLGNAGGYIPHTTILHVTAADGTDVVPQYVPPAPVAAASPQAAYVITSILAGNTVPAVNPFWGKFEITGPGGKHRPATLKTGTNNDARDLNAYGYLAPPSAAARANGAYALAAGAWNGNSDNSVVSTPQNPVFSIDVTTYVWEGFMQEASKTWPIADFPRPAGLADVRVDPWTGLLPAAGGESAATVFIDGTQPTTGVDALSSPASCADAVFATTGFESKFANWLAADQDWLARAARGPGVPGPGRVTRTAYFYAPGFHPYGLDWGPVTNTPCGASPSPSESPTIAPCPTDLVPPVPEPSPGETIGPVVPPGASATPCLPVVIAPSPSESASAGPTASGSPPPTQPPPTQPPPTLPPPTAAPTPPPATASPTPPPATAAPTPTPAASASAAAPSAFAAAP